MGVAGMGAVPAGLVRLYFQFPGTSVPGFHIPPFGLVPERFKP